MYDVIIIGKGPAGISTALYTQRANLSTLVIGKDGGALEKTGKIENYYGFPNGISGRQLIENGEEQAKNLGISIIEEEVLEISFDITFKIITTKNEYESKVVVIATGVNRVILPIQGLKEYEGKGISYCAICDGFFFRGKDVAVLGNGNYAIHEIEQLLPIVNSVTMLTNGKKAPELRSDKIKINEKEIREFRGDSTIKEISFKDETTLPMSGIFIAEGTASSIDFARKLGAKIENQKIVVDNKMQTNIPGLYAVGDCSGGLLQIAKAVGDGAIARNRNYSLLANLRVVRDC